MFQLKLSPLPIVGKRPEAAATGGTDKGRTRDKKRKRNKVAASATQPNRFQSPYQHSEKAVLIFHRPRHFQKRIVCIRIHTNTLARTSYILKTIFVIDFEDKCIYFVRNNHLLLLKSCRHLHYLILLYTKNP